ncbi:hypothetical protein ACQQ2Q_10000 [Agrobacterium sp. ES01]|uniref:hypothetical protein n=1 Tax=Agrobacterium sp. ES01 TaxID=3420714 RepID=UPI003D14CF94
MNLSRPTQIVFLISLVLAIVALLMVFNVLHFVGIPAFWLMTAAFGLLCLGNVVKGL